MVRITRESDRSRHLGIGELKEIVSVSESGIIRNAIHKQEPSHGVTILGGYREVDQFWRTGVSCHRSILGPQVPFLVVRALVLQKPGSRVLVGKGRRN
jgi:hypothetical protein